MSRSNLIAKRNARPKHYHKNDQSLLCEIGTVIRERPEYGYRRVTALLRRKFKEEGSAVVNHKRIYRLMKRNELLLKKTYA